MEQVLILLSKIESIEEIEKTVHEHIRTVDGKNSEKLFVQTFVSIFGGGAQHAAKNQKNAKFSFSVNFFVAQASQLA